MGRCSGVVFSIKIEPHGTGSMKYFVKIRDVVWVAFAVLANEIREGSDIPY
jgi:hypothetical protein